MKRIVAIIGMIAIMMSAISGGEALAWGHGGHHGRHHGGYHRGHHGGYYGGHHGRRHSGHYGRIRIGRHGGVYVPGIVSIEW